MVYTNHNHHYYFKRTTLMRKRRSDIYRKCTVFSALHMLPYLTSITIMRRVIIISQFPDLKTKPETKQLCSR